jgi:hypothetical protein
MASDKSYLPSEVVEWLATRKEAGLRIDPETAEARWEHGQVCDPYGVDPNLPEEYQCIGRNYFARSPGSNVWVSFYDLPEVTRVALWKKHQSKLSFPAGLLDVPPWDRGGETDDLPF